MIRTKVPEKLSTGPKVITVNDEDRARYVGDLHSAVRAYMVKAFRAYMKSPAWALLRINVIARDKVCQNCGKPHQAGAGFTAHHTSYEHWGKGNHEEREDVILLCRGCHSHADHSHAPFWAKRQPEVDYISMAQIERINEALEGLYDNIDFEPEQ